MAWATTPTAHIATQVLSSEQLQYLDGFSERRLSFFGRFHHGLEAAYQLEVRHEARVSRLMLTLFPVIYITFIIPLFLQQGVTFWSLNQRSLVLLIEHFLIAPVFFIAALMQYFLWFRPYAEKILIAAALILLVLLEFFSMYAVPWQDPLPTGISMAVMVALLAPGRIALSRSLSLFVAYLALIVLFESDLLNWVGRRHRIDLVVEMTVLTVCLISGVSSDWRNRRRWAAVQVLATHAMKDVLTGSHNRRYLLDLWPRILNQAVRDGRSVFVMLFDLDHFKQLNDACGHQAGDMALARFGALLSAHARRPLDVAARIGGEEFVLVLHGCNRLDGERLAEQIRTELEALRIPVDADGKRHLTVSTGAICVSALTSFEHIYSLADTCLYQAKHGGRNRVVLMPEAA